ncbi:hypothetical protein [Salinicola sp. CPA57]|uniref:hypothetical protein n=1 Tax=Salinicola sp. CPA57 TaxID=1949080 RepID=UPI001E54DA75|nr:hypothetical protein [Salinicola sp. CPA57]
MALGLAKLGLMTVESIWMSLAGLVPVYVGTRLGGIVRQRMDAEAFRKVVLMMLIVFGVVLVGKTALAWFGHRIRWLKGGYRPRRASLRA